MTAPTLRAFLALSILLCACSSPEKKVAKTVIRHPARISDRWTALSADGYKCSGIADSVGIGDTITCRWEVR